MPTLTCAYCGKPYQALDLTEKNLACPHCGSKNVVPLHQTPEIKAAIAQEQASRRVPGETPTAQLAARLIANIEKVIVGKYNEILLTVMAYFADGHVLLEDVPGVAKTMLARALSRSVGCDFKRLQCTPDLLPNDITGSSIFNPKTTQFEFRPGPLFTQILLADEINRATPRAQAALLEAMAERKVSADGTNYELTPPFFLIATQNPIDHEGTFPLPEAQLDRFLARLSLGYPEFENEVVMLQRLKAQHPIDDLDSVATAADILNCQTAVREIHADEKVLRYIVQLIQATREHYDIRLGASPRASMSLLRCAQSIAAIQGFEFITPDDVKYVAPFVLAHRLILKPESRLRKVTVQSILEEILKSVPVPLMQVTTASLE
ncbi:MAG TPA: MoxR family ATPase [Verrucomicrobiae bacterium]|jgi:MoxR-like ATPase|nr:MoxR family ATPase [Verrucomicrobiae bacterium]